MAKTSAGDWILCACPECDKEFIAKIKGAENRMTSGNLFGLKPKPEELTCPYCGVKNDIYAEAFVKVNV